MVAEFAEKGVVVIPGVFSSVELEEMRAEADYIASVSLNAVRFLRILGSVHVRM